MAAKENANTSLLKKVSRLSVRDRFRKLSRFEKEDLRDIFRSGTGGEFGELDDLLAEIIKAIYSTKEVNSTARIERDVAARVEKYATQKRKMDPGAVDLRRANGADDEAESDISPS